MKKIICLFIAIVGVFSACEKNITIDIPEKEPKLVVNGWLEKDALIELTVGKSQNILKPLDNYNLESYYLKTAQPVIFENGVAIDTLVYQAADYGYKSIHDKKIRAGNTYSVKVIAPGYPEVTAATVVPSQSVITELTRQRDVRVNSYGEHVDDIFIKLDDPIGEKNFYLIQFYSAGYSAGIDGYTIGCVSTTDKDIEATSGEDDPTDPDNCYDGGSLLMKDVNFNGRQKQVKFSIVSDMLMDHVYNGKTYRPYVKVYRITEDYFKFVRSMSLFNNSNDNPFAEPVNVFSNVNKGYGIFSAYTTAVDTLR